MTRVPWGRMGIQRLENVGIVVEDLTAVRDFFVALGLSVEGEASVEGDWVDRTVGLEDVRSDIVMLVTPDGHGRLELQHYRHPAARDAARDAPPNTHGLHRVAFGVDDVDAAVRTAVDGGARLLGDIVRYEDAYRICYLRGPEGIIVMLAERLG
ncbi:VOC family protein [Citricoccus sp.]|nr:VOC family protein [Citricoccus sp.]